MTSRENCQTQLADSRVQQKLVDIFVFYFDDLQDIVHLASAQHDGQRPESLTNEIYSCFHHIARGLCVCTDVTDVLAECKKACDSHLKRATLNSYKLAVNSFLREDVKLREILDYLVLVEDFEKYVPDGMVKVREIRDLAFDVRAQLKQAKKHEAYGEFSKAMVCFNDALEKGTDLRDRITDFTDNKTYLLACAREARDRKQRKKDRSNAIVAAITSAVISSILTAVCTVAIQNWYPSQSGADTAQQEQSEQSH